MADIDLDDVLVEGELLRRTGDDLDGLSPAALAASSEFVEAIDAAAATAVAAVVDGAPGSLNTLNELAAALGDNASFAATVTSALALKAPLASPTLTGTPAAPTAAAGTSTTQIATTAFVQQETPAASTTVVGMAELATAAETSAGSDGGRVVTPDGLAGSIFGIESVTIQVFDAATEVTTGNGAIYFRVPPALNGMNLVSVGAGVLVKSTSGNPTIQIARGRQSSATSAHSFVDMLSTRITIDANDYDSKDAGTAAVIAGSNDDVATGDLIRIDVDLAGTGTTGLFLTLGFQLP